MFSVVSFNTQPPEGGWFSIRPQTNRADRFNTQPPEGGWNRLFHWIHTRGVSTPSRLKAAGPFGACRYSRSLVSTHSRLKAAGPFQFLHFPILQVSTHSRPKAAVAKGVVTWIIFVVSTHSRPKAAGVIRPAPNLDHVFQHTAARRRLLLGVNHD